MDTSNLFGWIIILGIALACGWRAGNILSYKGRSWWIGFLLGCLFGLIGIFFAYAVPATAEVKQQNVHR
jgi:hypothetical protein